MQKQALRIELNMNIQFFFILAPQMLNRLNFFIFLVLAAIPNSTTLTASPATYSFPDSTNCIIIAKNLNIKVVVSEQHTSTQESPSSSDQVVAIERERTNIIILELPNAINHKDPCIEITIPPMCKLSCYLTDKAHLEVTNSTLEKIAPLSLNLFNGGCVKINNGAYLSYSVNILGLGDVTMTDVDEEGIFNAYINGFGTLRKNQNSLKMGGMSLKNGGRAYFGNNVISGGKRTNYIPKFQDISLEDLASYALRSKKHTELPDGWSNNLPEKNDHQMCDVQTKKPEVTIIPQADLPVKSQPLATTLDTEIKLKEDALRNEETAEDIKLYGKQIRYLSYETVKAILLDDVIYQGILPKDFFRINGIHSDYHPYSLEALANRIKFSTATNVQKGELWTIFLFRKLAVIDVLIDDFKRVRRMMIHTPNSLWGFVVQTSSLTSIARTLKPWIYTSLLLAGEWGVAVKGPEVLRTQFKRSEVVAAGITLLPITFLWFYRKGNLEANRELNRNMFVIKTLEACVEKAFYYTQMYKDYMPADLVEFVHTFNKKDCEMRKYITDGKIDFELFNQYHTEVCAFYNELGRRAKIIH